MEVLMFLPFCSAWKKQEQRGWVAQGCVHPPLVAQTGPSWHLPVLPGTGCPRGLSKSSQQNYWSCIKCLVLLRSLRASSHHPGTLSSSSCLALLAPALVCSVLAALLSWKALFEQSLGYAVCPRWEQSGFTDSTSIQLLCLSCIPKTPSTPTVLFLVA